MLAYRNAALEAAVMRGNDRSTHDIRAVLASDPKLSAWAEIAQDLASLDAILAGLLPPDLRQRCRAAASAAGTLIIECDNAAAASRLRNMAPSMLSALNMAGTSVHSLSIVLNFRNKARRPVKPSLTGEAKACIESLEEALESGPLKSALARLLRHQRQR